MSHDAGFVPAADWLQRSGRTAAGNYFLGNVVRAGTFSPLNFTATGTTTVMHDTVGQSDNVHALGRFDSAYVQVAVGDTTATVTMNLFADGKPPLEVSGDGTITVHSDTGCTVNHSRTIHTEVALTLPRLGATEVHLTQSIGCTP